MLSPGITIAPDLYMLKHVSILGTVVVRFWIYLPYCTHHFIDIWLSLPGLLWTMRLRLSCTISYGCLPSLAALFCRWGTEIVSNWSKITWLVNAQGLKSILPSTCSSPSLPSSFPQGRQQLPPSLVLQKPPRRTPARKVSVAADDELSPIVGSAGSLSTMAKEGWSPLRGWRNLCGAFETLSGEWGLAPGCQTAELLLHLVSKWCERGQAEIWTSLIPSHPWPHPSHGILFPGPCLTQKDLLAPPPSSPQALPHPACPVIPTVTAELAKVELNQCWWDQRRWSPNLLRGDVH